MTIINESLARRLFGRENPLGRRLVWPRFIRDTNPMELEIVGVVKDAKYLNLRDQASPMFYTSFYEYGRGQMTLVVRTVGDPTTVATAVQREARSLDQAMPIFQVERLATQLEASLTQERLIATLSSSFGLMALSLACIGLYGILSYTVAQRTREIGIRLALGAQPRDVRWLVLRDALRLVLIGISIGAPAAAGAMRLVSSQLFGVNGADPFTILTASSILLAVAALSSYLPARQATKVDPLIALHCE